MENGGTLLRFDMITIGGGFAGLIAANRAAELGLEAADFRV